MRKKAETVLHTLNNRLGYGDVATCKYLFIGVEEGGGPYNLDDFPIHVKPMELWQGTVSKARLHWSPVYTVISKVVAALENIAGLEDYQSQTMCHAGDVTCLMNIFPLPKKEIKTWPYKTLTREQYQEWLFNHLGERFATIRHEQSKMSQLTATICFGSENWQDFINCLSLSWDAFEEHCRTSKVRVYAKRRILLTPFLAPRWGSVLDADISQLAEIIKSLNTKQR